MDRWFRIDALLLDNQADDGDGPHEELYQMLWLHPAVATFGMTSTTVGALRYLKERVVNTIFVNVRPVPHAVFWQELNEFLVKMHEEEPNVLIVFYAKKNEYESFLARHPSFEKYYFVPAEWVSPGEPNKIPSHEDFQKFDRWHRRKYSWDVCVSYASENKAVAEAIHKGLCARQTNVFFGDYERADLWGKNWTMTFRQFSKINVVTALFFFQRLTCKKHIHNWSWKRPWNGLETGFGKRTICLL